MKIGDYELNIPESELDNIIERQTRVIELIDSNFETYVSLPEGDKKALAHLVKAAKIINDVALKQDHPLNMTLKRGLEAAADKNSYAAKALRLFNSLNGVAGFNGIDRNPVEIFKGVHLLSGRNFYPADLSVEEFHSSIIRMAKRGKFDEIGKILSNRTMVRRNGDELKAIDFTEFFEKEFSLAANELEVAAHYCTDEDFKDYLGWQAQALIQNNPDMDMLADKHWAVLQNCSLEFTLSRENYEDELTGTIYDNPKLIKIIAEHNIEVVAKDTLGCRVGIVNAQATKQILKSRETLPYLAQWMPFHTEYTQSFNTGNNKQAMVDVDLMALTGDYAMCRGGITTAQNLPNNDKLSIKTGGGRRNVYHRQVRFSNDKERLKKLLECLVAPELHQYVDINESMSFVIGHENGHSLGPDSGYQNSLGIYKHIIEEHKADIISVASIAELKRKFENYAEVNLKKFYTTWVVTNLFLRARPVLAKPHRVAELIQFNYLLDHNVIFFDEDKKLRINFNLMETVVYQLLQDTIKIQLSKSTDNAKIFIDKWAKWGEWPEYISAVQQKLGIKPYIVIREHF